jgi:hypothetical protein
MANLLLHVNGWNSGWSGNWANVDDPVSAPDGQTVTTSTSGASVTFDVESVTGTISDADFVSGISVELRSRKYAELTAEPPEVEIAIEVLIGGISQGTESRFQVSNFQNRTLTNAGWDSDWTEAQLNGMQIRATATKIAGIGAWTAYIDCIDINVAYVAPVVAEPAAATLNLAGKAPNLVQEGQRVPSAAALVLGGTVAVVNNTISVPTGALDVSGQVAFVAPNVTQVQPNAWDSGWPVGFVANIDDPTSNPDGQYISTGFVNDVTFIDFENPSGITEADTVLSVSLVVRARGVAQTEPELGFASIEAELYVSGSLVGPTKTLFNLPTSFVNRSLSDTAWNQDWTPTQLNSMQVRLKSGGPLAEDWYVDGIDLIIEYDPQSPLIMRPPVGTLSLASAAPSTSQGFYFVPAVEALTFTEYIPDLTSTLEHKPGPDELMFSMQVPVRLVNHVPAPAVEALTLNGQLPVRLDEGSETPTEETLALAGKVPTLGRTANHTAYPSLGTITSFLEVAGAEEPGKANRIVQHEQLNFSIDTFTLDQTTNSWRLMPQGAASLTGYAPSLDSYSLPIAAEVLVLTGKAPGSSGNLNITAPVLTLTFASVAPQTVQDFLQLELLGYAPTMDFGLTTTELALILQGYVPNSLNATRLVPETTLSLAGQAPTLEVTKSKIGDPTLISLTTRYDIEFIAAPTDILIE